MKTPVRLEFKLGSESWFAGADIDESVNTHEYVDYVIDALAKKLKVLIKNSFD